MHNKTCIESTKVDNLTNDFVNLSFANTGKLEDEIYPSTVSEIAAEQHKDNNLQRYFKKHVEIDHEECMFH